MQINTKKYLSSLFVLIVVFRNHFVISSDNIEDIQEARDEAIEKEEIIEADLVDVNWNGTSK